MHRDLLIRPAAPADAGAVAALHVASWRSAYRGILPDAYLASQAASHLAAHWRAKLRAADPLTLVAERDGSYRGFVAASLGTEPGVDGFIDNLHVRPDLTGHGIGRRLLGAIAAQLIAEGCSDAGLWVFDANQAAIRFYLRLGAAAERHGFDEIAGAAIPHTLLVWRDLAGLGAATAAVGAA